MGILYYSYVCYVLREVHPCASIKQPRTQEIIILTWFLHTLHNASARKKQEKLGTVIVCVPK